MDGAWDSWKQTLAELVGDRLGAFKRQAFLLCGDDSHVEGLVQEALVRAFARLPSTLGPGANRRRDGTRPRRPGGHPRRHADRPHWATCCRGSARA